MTKSLPLCWHVSHRLLTSHSDSSSHASSFYQPRCIHDTGRYRVRMHETRITYQIWKLSAPVDTDVSLIKLLKRPIPTLMEGNKDRHDFAGM